MTLAQKRDSARRTMAKKYWVNRANGKCGYCGRPTDASNCENCRRRRRVGR